MVTEMCCGTTCDVLVRDNQLRAEGAKDFLAYLEDNVTEDMSTEALEELLYQYQQGLTRYCKPA